MRYTDSAHISGTINDKPFIDIDKKEYAEQNGILIYTHLHDEIMFIAPNNNVNIGLVSILNFGDFVCYKLLTQEGIIINIYKRIGQTDMNKTSLITNITHKTINYLSFGDYDDINGINDLLKISKNNKEKYYAIYEKIHEVDLILRKIKSEFENNYINLNKIIHNQTVSESQINKFLLLFDQYIDLSDEFGKDIEKNIMIQNPEEKSKKIDEISQNFYLANKKILSQMTSFLSVPITLKTKETNISNTDEQEYIHKFINLLEDARNLAIMKGRYHYILNYYPFLKANVFKWFHHEDAFDILGKEEIIKTVENIESILNPNFIMHEKYPNQKNFGSLYDKLPQETQKKMHSTNENDNIFFSKHKIRGNIAA